MWRVAIHAYHWTGTDAPYGRYHSLIVGPSGPPPPPPPPSFPLWRRPLVLTRIAEYPSHPIGTRTFFATPIDTAIAALCSPVTDAAPPVCTVTAYLKSSMPRLAAKCSAGDPIGGPTMPSMSCGVSP